MSTLPTEIIDRYWEMLKDVEAICEPEPGTSIPHLKWMLTELRIDKEIGKHNRWLGFIQYGLIINGYTTTTAERNFTRPYFTETQNMHTLPTKAEAELLDILQEECAEVIQAIAKIKRHGWDSYNPDILASPDNRDHLAVEIGHVLVLIGTLMNDGHVSEQIITEGGEKKQKQLEKYTHFQEFSIDKWTE